MSLDTDHIVDRRRMRRKLTFWRTLAVLIAIAAVLGVATMFRGSSTSLVQASGPQISRVTIRGIIRGDEDRLKALESLANSRATRAVIVHIDSPGGTTVGSEELHDALRRVANKKPMVVVVDGMAASGGYIAAMAADHILTQKTSLVGSIGVLFQVPNVSHLLETIGVKVEEIKSSPLKAAPNGLEPTSPEARAAIESLVRDSYAWFKDMVKERRKLDGEALDRVSDGRVFTGRQASRAQARRRDRPGARGDRMARQDEQHRSQDAGSRLAADAALQRAVLHPSRHVGAARSLGPRHGGAPAGIARAAADC